MQHGRFTRVSTRALQSSEPNSGSNSRSSSSSTPAAVSSPWTPILRAMPLYAGATGAILTVAHRAVSGLAPVADAASAQSRADVLCLAMAAALALTGLSWKSTSTRIPESEEPGGAQVDAPWCAEELSRNFAREVTWLWEAVRGVNGTVCACAVFVENEDGTLRRLLHAGRAYDTAAASNFDAPVACPSLVRLALDTSKGQYWANTVLFPDAPETLKGLGLPPKARGLLVQPSEKYAVVLTTDAVRGLSRVDQAWLADIADKLASTS